MRINLTNIKKKNVQVEKKNDFLEGELFQSKIYTPEKYQFIQNTLQTNNRTELIKYLPRNAQSHFNLKLNLILS